MNDARIRAVAGAKAPGMRSGQSFRRAVLVTCAALVLVAADAPRGTANTPNFATPAVDTVDSSGARVLPNGTRITPAGRDVPLPGDFPVAIVPAADGKSLYVETAGYHDQGVHVVDIASGTVTANAPLVKDFAGLAYDASHHTLFVSGGGALGLDPERPSLLTGATDAVRKQSAFAVVRFRADSAKLTPDGGAPFAGASATTRHFVGGVVARDGTVYAADIDGDAVMRFSGPTLRADGSVAVGYRPCAIALSPNGMTLAVANWGGASVDLIDPATLQVRSEVLVGEHPAALAYAGDGRLFVADAGTNSVAVISDGMVEETVSVALSSGDAPVGTTPVALAYDANSQRLYVADADNNDVAVIDVAIPGKSHVLGFIPTGWYPSALAVSADGTKLYIGTAKGWNFRANAAPVTAHPRRDPDPAHPFDYIGDVLSGDVAIVTVPQADDLARFTAQAIANRATIGAANATANAASVRGAFAKIKHVVYVIRENRTYDQVFGDLGRGNGDPSLTLFGEKVTPNAHAIAKRWVTLDELFSSGEVSEDGHQWTDAAYATDFTEKAWTNSYSGRGEPDADARLVSSPAGYLWDDAARHGLTYRSYGEFALFTSTPDSPPIARAVGSLVGHYSEPWRTLSNRHPYPRDTQLVDIFAREFAADEARGTFPQLTIMWLPEDHTEGLKAGALSPTAHVASNDLALGRVLELLSKSPDWKSTAVFVIEDDAQNGPDHVDAHRTVGLVASPYVRRGVVDSTQYSTVSLIRTIEIILGLSPLSQYDANATPMTAAFTTVPDFSPYRALPAQTPLDARNPMTGPGARASAKLDLSAPDRADPNALNEILWNALKPGVAMPAAVHSAGPAVR